jgi:DNA-directed RNA polymerase subunit K/omega
MGAKPMIKNYKGFSYSKIAEEEFKLNMIPFKIIRPLPNNKYELWSLDELYKEHLYNQL